MSTNGRGVVAWDKTIFCLQTSQESLALEKKVKKEVQKLIKQGVIECIPANECALWISPAGFVAKDKKEEKLHLVCDLRNLARHKLEFGWEVDFAGTHIGGKDGFRPTTANQPTSQY